MVLAIDRILLHVSQRVVHPPHVPLEVEAESAEVGGTRHLRPGGGFLGHDQRAGNLRVRDFVEFAHELDCLEVLASAVAVGDPFAFVARVVEVKHRRDRVHAQTVDVELLQPEHRAGNEEVLHLIAAEIEDQRGPVEVFAQARVFMLVQCGPVETAQAVGILGEMRRHPVQDHADPVAVAVIDKPAEIVRRAETAGWRIVAGGLVAPGLVVGVLGHRHQFDVREPESESMVDQHRRQLAVVQQFAFRASLPRTEMHLIDRHRFVLPVERGALVQP